MDASSLARFERSVSRSRADWALWVPFSLPPSLSVSPLKLCRLLRDALRRRRFPGSSARPVRLFPCRRAVAGSAWPLCPWPLRPSQPSLRRGEQARARKNGYGVFLKGSRSKQWRKTGGTFFFCSKIYITKFAILTISKCANSLTIMTFTAPCSRLHHLLLR